MPREIMAGEPDAARRQVDFYLVGTDFTTPALAEGGGQPKISADGAALTATGIGPLVAVGEGAYYAVLTPAAVSVAGVSIRAMYKSASTAECPSPDLVRVVAQNPFDLGGSVTQSLGSVTIVIDSPLSPDGADMRVIRGDDYSASDRQVWEWASSAWPDLTGAAVYWEPAGLDRVALSVLSATGTRRVRLELTRSVTSMLNAFANFSVRAYLASGRVVTLLSGRVRPS